MKKRTTRAKVSVSLPLDLIEQIDRQARKTRDSRSGVLEEWLRSEARRKAQDAYDDEVRAYYAAQSATERAEDEAISRAATARSIEQLRREEAAAELNRKRSNETKRPSKEMNEPLEAHPVTRGARGSRAARGGSAAHRRRA